MKMVRGANTITAIYLAVGITWIFVSDLLPLGNATAYYQTLKGILYVAVTGALLWLFIRRMESRNRKILEELKLRSKKISETEQALIKERNLLRTVIDNLPDYVYVKDLNGRFIICNKAFSALVGASESLLGKTTAELFKTEESASYENDDQQVAQSRQPLVNLEGFIKDAEGNTKRILTTKVPLTDNNDNITGIVGISRDITELHFERINEEIALKIIEAIGANEILANGLRESLQILGEHFGLEFAEAWLVEPSKEAISLASTWAKNKNSRFHQNHKQRFMRGEGLPGQPFLTKQVEIWTDIMNHKLFTRKDRAAAEGLHTGIGIPLVLHNEVIAVFTFLSKQKFDNHRALKDILEKISVQIVLHLERKQYELELEENNQRTTNILESISDAFYSVSNDWTVIYWNSEAEKLLQMPREKIIGQKLFDFYSVEHLSHQKLHDVYTKVMSEKTHSVMFEEFYEPMNSWLEISVYPSTEGISVFFRDITENRKLREELQQRVDELAVSNAELEQFAYIASHDMQEPLRMVTGFLTQLEKKYKDLLDEKGKQYIGFAVDGAARMRQLILDLLEYSKVGKTDIKVESIDVGRLLSEILTLNQRLLLEENVTIDIGEMPVITGTKSLIQQVFHNLILNAVKYRKPAAEPIVSISASEKETHWQFAISDNGIGIESDYYDRIFVIFQRLHTKDEYSGTGIGLAICKKIVENHGGRIWVESALGEGSTFYFTIKK